MNPRVKRTQQFEKAETSLQNYYYVKLQLRALCIYSNCYTHSYYCCILRQVSHSQMLLQYLEAGLTLIVVTAAFRDRYYTHSCYSSYIVLRTPSFLHPQSLLPLLRVTFTNGGLIPIGLIPRKQFSLHRDNTVVLYCIVLQLLMMIAFVQRYSPLSSSLTAFACDSQYMSDQLFIARFLISTKVVQLQRWHGWCHMTLLPSRRKFCVHHTTMHHVTSCKATYVRCMRVQL